MIEARQIRAARALLDWTRDDLAKASGVSVPALTQIEGEHRAARTSSLDKIRACLEAAGIVFTDNMGVKMKSDLLTVYEGREGLHRFYDDVYVTMLHNPGEVLIGGGYQEDFFEAAGEDFVKMHAERVKKIPGFKVRALKPYSNATEGAVDYLQYRFLPDHMFMSLPFYVYGNKVGLLSWKPAVRVVVINDGQIAESYRCQFDVIWKSSRIQVEDA